MSEAIVAENGNGQAPFIEDLFQSFYYNYAMAVIMDRSVPDARDGLKPVHRRILYAMHKLRLAPGSPTRKSARVVGDVIGQFHPHGDQAVYDALVRLAQDWSLRYPLVKGQGNFGSLDGDNAAAMRYTECRLTELGQSMMDAAELKEDVIGWQPNYDDSTMEPEVLPAKFPMLLCNGTEGIAVGIASSIPPHNMTEVMNACIALAGALSVAEATDALDDEVLDKLVFEHVKGPDFPTGGIVHAPREEIRDIYRKGEGSLRLRARWETERLPRGRWQIVVTEIPYMVAKGALLESIGALMEARKLPLVEDVVDESEADGVRIVIVPKSSQASADAIMDRLFAETGLENAIKVNCNVIVTEGPKRRAALLSIPQILKEYLKFREGVVVQRSKSRLAEVRDRIHIIEGRLIVLADIEEVIRIIRTSDEPEDELMARFGLSRVQADDIMALRLRQLKKLEEMVLREEKKRLTTEKNHLLRVINERAFRWKEIGREFEQVRDQYGDERRTEIVHARPAAAAASAEDLILREPITVAFSKMGWVRAVKGRKDEALAVKDGDKLACQRHGYTTDHAVFVNRKGRVFSMLANDIPCGRGYGDPISKWFTFPAGEFPGQMFVVNRKARCLVATANGNAFICTGDDLVSRNRKGKAFVNLKAGDEVLTIAEIPDGCDAAAFIADDGYMLIVRLDELPTLAKGAGVRAIRLGKEAGKVRQAMPVRLDSELRVGSPARASTISADELRQTYLGERARRGAPLPRAARNGTIQTGG